MYIAEVPVRLGDLVGIAQRLEHQPTPARLEADDIFAAPERKLAEPDLSGPLERLAQHDERFLGEIVGGHHEIGLFVIEHVDLVRVDELRQLERLLRFELDRVDLVLVEQDIFALLRSEEHTSELQSLLRISYAVFCLKKKNATVLQY